MHNMSKKQIVNLPFQTSTYSTKVITLQSAQTKILEDALPFLQPHSQSSRKTCSNNDQAKGIQPRQLSPPSTTSSTQAAALAQTTATASCLVSQLPVFTSLDVVESLSHVQLFVTAWSAAREASCPSLPPGACSNSCRSIISSSVVPSLPAF